MVNAEVVAYGRYVPEEVLGNDFFAGKEYKVHTGEDAAGNPVFKEQKVFLTEDKILYSTGGIRERRRVAPNETIVDLIEKAVRKSDFPLNEIRGIVVGTISDDIRFPSVACRTQERLGIPKIENAVDLGAACSGFAYAIDYARLRILDGSGPQLAIGVETLTRITDYEELDCDLFGDGIGFVVLAPTNDNYRGILKTALVSDVSPVRGIPATRIIYRDRQGFLRMPHGPKVKVAAWRGMVDISCKLLEEQSLTKEDVKLIIPSQANGRILDSVEENLELDGRKKVYRNIDRLGNTSAASVPMAYAEAREQGLISTGDLVMGVSVGAGMVFGAYLERI